MTTGVLMRNLPTVSRENSAHSSLSIDERSRREITRLRDELAELQERFSSYKSAMEPAWAPPMQLRLTRSEGIVLGVIYRRQYATPDMIMSVLYDGRREFPSERSAESLIRLVRKKLAFFQIAIQNRWGLGFFMSAADKAKLDAMAVLQRIEMAMSRRRAAVAIAGQLAKMPHGIIISWVA